MVLETLTDKKLQDEVLALCEETGISPEEASARIAELEQEDYLKNYPPAQRTFNAVKVFRAEANARLASSAEQYIVRVLATSPPDRGTKKAEKPGKKGDPFYIPGRILAVGYPIDKTGKVDGPTGLVNIAFFEDHESKRKEFDVGGTYITRLTTSNDVNPQKPQYQCSVDNSFSVKQTEDIALPEDFNKWLKSILHYVPVKEKDDPKHHSKDYELRLVIGTVAYGNMRNTKIGPMANLEVFDETVEVTKKDAKRLQVRIPPTEFKYGTGSDVIAIGPLKKRTGKNRQQEVQEYLSLNANFVFTPPNGLIVPRKAPPVSAKNGEVTEEAEEEVDVSDFE